MKYATQEIKSVDGCGTALNLKSICHLNTRTTKYVL